MGVDSLFVEFYIGFCRLEFISSASMDCSYARRKYFAKSFFGPSLNAARGIAVQVNGAITAFVSNFQLAVNPQIVKKYAQEEIEDMLKLLVYSSKYSYFYYICLFFLFIRIGIYFEVVVAYST